MPIFLHLLSMCAVPKLEKANAIIRAPNQLAEDAKLGNFHVFHSLTCYCVYELFLGLLSSASRH